MVEDGSEVRRDVERNIGRRRDEKVAGNRK